jgi:hypothetical protein
VRSARFLGTLLYVGYLVHVGLLMVILPWSTTWPMLLVKLPPAVGMTLDLPAVRGAISGFGVLHLLLVVAELVVAHRREAG